MPFQYKHQIPFTAFPLLNPLLLDYLAAKESLQHLYNYPFDLSSFAKAIDDKRKQSINRPLLVEVLKEQYSPLETKDVVTMNIELLGNENTFTIVAAHQPCLFLGPLFNIYKIACTINVCKQLKHLHPSNNFVPVFWMGSEDHDFAELNNTFVAGQKIEWNIAASGAVGRINTESLKDSIAELKTLLGDSIAAKSIVEKVEKGIAFHPTFGNFTQYLLNELFGEFGLIVLDQDSAKLKKHFAPIIHEEVFNQRAIGLLQNNIQFLQTNYKAQASPREINFFYLTADARERILFNSTKQQFEVNNTALVFSPEQMQQEIEEHPERFSPNVILRPVYQELILPNLAFVGGQGELSYWLQLKPVFDHFNVNYPMLILRNSAMVISPSTQKKLEKLNLPEMDFFTDVEKLVNQYLKQHSEGDLELGIEKHKIEELYTELATKAAAIDASLTGSVAAEKQKALNTIDALSGKLLKAAKRKEEQTVSQIRAVHAALFPQGILQERVENFLPLYVAHGSAFLETVVEHCNPFTKSMLFFSELN